MAHQRLGEGSGGGQHVLAVVQQDDGVLFGQLDAEGLDVGLVGDLL